MRLQASDRSDLAGPASIVVGAGPDGSDVTLDQVAKLDIVKTPGRSAGKTAARSR